MSEINETVETADTDAEIAVPEENMSAETNLDTETEEEILQNFQKVSEDKTTLIVSHRLSSVKNADTILVLENGNIIQQGTHTELLNTEGYYKELYHKQLLEKEM